MSRPTCAYSAWDAQGAHLVAGPGHARGVRARRGRDRRQLLPHARHRAGRQRLHDGPPRVQLTPAATRSSRCTRRCSCTCRARRRAALAAARLDRAGGRLATGLVVWEWHSLGHVPLARVLRHARQQRVLRRLPHQLDPGAGAGRVLVSARDTSAVYEIDRRQRADRLDARRQGQRLPARPRRALLFQHDARMLPRQPVSLFDDEAGPPQKGPPRAAWCSRSTGAGTRPRSCEYRRARTRPPRAREACRRSAAEHVPRLRRGAVLLGVLERRPAALRRPAAAGRRQLPRLQLPLAGEARAPGRRAARRTAAARLGLRELERRHGGRALAGAGGPRARPRSRRWDPGGERVPDPLDVPGSAGTFAVRALRSNGRRARRRPRRCRLHDPRGLAGGPPCAPGASPPRGGAVARGLAGAAGGGARRRLARPGRWSCSSPSTIRTAP